MPDAAPPRPNASRVFHRMPKKELPVAVGGEGIHLVDAAGRRYIDASGGAAVSCLGHGHPRVIAAIKRQAEMLAYAHTSFFTTEVAEELAGFLIDDHGSAPAYGVAVLSGAVAALSGLLGVASRRASTGEPEAPILRP